MKLGRVIARTANVVIGTYKRHEFHITRELNRRIGKEWYITVIAPSGEYAYDGWWGEYGSTMQEAIEQAARGSCLLGPEAGRK